MPADNDPASEPRPRAVLDPSWEVALRTGQEAAGDRGSVEDELAIVHLLRHARAPQAPDDATLDAVWADVDAGLEPMTAASGWRAWLQRPWLLGGSAALAAAAAAVLVVVWSGPVDGPPRDDSETLAQADPPAEGDPKTMAALVEAQFAALEPGARAAVERSVDEGRSSLRGDLIAAAMRADGRTMGGAP